MAESWSPPANPFSVQQGYQDAVAAYNRNKLFPIQQQQAQTDLQRSQVGLQTDQQQLQARQVGALQSMMAQTTDDSQIPDLVHRAVAAGLISPDLAAHAMGGNVEGLDLGTIHALRRQATMGAGNAPEVEAMTGSPTQVNTGGQTQTVNVNRFTGQVEPMSGGAASLPNTLSPEAEAAPRSFVDPEGVTHQVPTSAVVTPTGQARPNVAGLTDASGALAGSLPPGSAEARAAQGQASGQQYAADLAESGSSAQRVATLKEVSTLLQSPEGKTGPGTQVTNGWRNFLLGNLPLLANVIPGGLDKAKLESATQDEIKKYMTQIAGNAAAQYGPGTNEKLAVAASGNANPDLSNLANQDVTRMNIALERAKQARLAAFQRAGRPAEDYSKFSADWNRTTDPRAFMLDLLTPAERRRFLSGVTTTAGKNAILRGKSAAENAGLFQESDIPR